MKWLPFSKRPQAAFPSDRRPRQQKGSIKLITAIVQDEDAGRLLDHLMEAGFRATKLGSTGGFLKKGNVTLIMGVEKGDVEEVLGILRANCRTRTELLSSKPAIEVTVGGAFVFIQDVERCETL